MQLGLLVLKEFEVQMAQLVRKAPPGLQVQRANRGPQGPPGPPVLTVKMALAPTK